MWAWGCEIQHNKHIQSMTRLTWSDMTRRRCSSVRKKHIRGSMVGQQWETDVKVHWKTPLPSLMTPPWWEAWRRSSLSVETRSDDRTRRWWPHFSQVDQEHHQTSGRPAVLERDREGRSSGNKESKLKLLHTLVSHQNTSRSRTVEDIVPCTETI